MAAGIQSAIYAGTIPAGSCFAAAQSVGVIGLGASTVMSGGAAALGALGVGMRNKVRCAVTSRQRRSVWCEGMAAKLCFGDDPLILFRLVLNIDQACWR